MAGSKERGRTVPDRDRRYIWRGLSVLWLFDAALKLQPKMFTPSLIGDILAPAAQDSQPPWVYNLIAFSARIWQHHMVLFELGIFLIEAFIGLALWFGPEQSLGRAGLIISIFWSAVVFVFAEGFGGIFTGSASFLSGFPGSGPVYIALAFILLKSPEVWVSARFRSWLKRGLGGFFLLSGLIQVMPGTGFWTGPGLAGTFGDVTMMGTQPVLVQRMLNAVLPLLLSAPVLFNLVFATILLAFGVFLWRGRLNIVGWRLLWVWLFFVWSFAQAFGTLFTGTGTDPGPLLPLALFLALYVRKVGLASYGKKSVRVGPTGS